MAPELVQIFMQGIQGGVTTINIHKDDKVAENWAPHCSATIACTLQTLNHCARSVSPPLTAGLAVRDLNSVAKDEWRLFPSSNLSQDCVTAISLYRKVVHDLFITIK